MPNGDRYVTRREFDATIGELEGRITNCTLGTGIGIAGGAAALAFLLVRIVGVVAVLAVLVEPAAAQGRKTQAVTGISLASLGVYAAAMDRDCDAHLQTTLLAGRCEWRTARGSLDGLPPELPRDQLAAGLTVAAIGGLMVGGAWEPSKAVDSIFTAGAGFLLLATSWDATWVRDTVHVDAGDGRRLTTCPDPRHWSYSWMVRRRTRQVPRALDDVVLIVDRDSRPRAGAAPRRPSAGVVVVRRAGPLQRGTGGRRRATVDTELPDGPVPLGIAAGARPRGRAPGPRRPRARRRSTSRTSGAEPPVTGPLRNGVEWPWR